jgi:hypothetical protein
MEHQAFVVKVLESFVAFTFALPLDLENVELLPALEVISGVLDVLLDKFELSAILKDADICLQAVIDIVDRVHFHLLVESAEQQTGGELDVDQEVHPLTQLLSLVGMCYRSDCPVVCFLHGNQLVEF